MVETVLLKNLLVELPQRPSIMVFSSYKLACFLLFVLRKGEQVKWPGRSNSNSRPNRPKSDFMRTCSKVPATEDVGNAASGSAICESQLFANDGNSDVSYTTMTMRVDNEHAKGIICKHRTEDFYWGSGENILRGLESGKAAVDMEWNFGRRTSFEKKTVQEKAKRVRNMLMETDLRIDMKEIELQSLKEEQRELQQTEEKLRSMLVETDTVEDALATPIDTSSIGPADDAAADEALSEPDSSDNEPSSKHCRVK